VKHGPAVGATRRPFRFFSEGAPGAAYWGALDWALYFSARCSNCSGGIACHLWIHLGSVDHKGPWRSGFSHLR
jgi:hypothetical protein